MASKNDVIAYLKEKIIEAGFVIETTYSQDMICLVIKKDPYVTPKICSKSELYAYAKAFFYVFIQKNFKKTSESS